ncbi:helix-turn-helix transcriptional regulator [Adlercreutzia sp. R7]|uniref:Helix-turn-helix transcriptional regulator n=1 Tax=Adlercreutzia wanghongyangiae TaxID=3111451 RepID=A0ABU6IFX1_9ACTN|nr:helix-turn-helix transcriptional regulator [Adlercreutzia sp. R7]
MASGDLKGFVEIASDEVRHHPARVLGMGLFWAWLQIVFASPALAPVAAWPLPLAPQQQVWTLSLGATLATFALVLALRKHLPASLSAGAVMLGHGLMAAGAMALAWSAIFPSLPLVLLGVAGTGLGSGFAFLAWGDHLARLAPRRVLFDMTAYSFLTAAFFGVVMLLPWWGVQMAVVAMPVVAGALLVRANRHLAPCTADVAPVPGAPSGLSLVGLAVLVGLVYGIMRGVSLSFAEGSFGQVTTATVMGIAGAGLLLAATTVFFRKGSELYLVCQISFPLLAAGFLLLPQFIGGLPLPVIVFTVGHSYFYSLLWVFCADRAQNSRRAPLVVFAVGLLSFLGGSLGGSLASDAMALVASEASQTITIVSLVVVYLFVVVFAYLFGKNRRAGLASTDEQRALDFKRCSELVAAEGGLSPREVEIFHLLALGKDRADIREICHISTDTVKSHTRRIYAKLDIHSKKEAQSLVEQRMEQERKGMIAR